MSGATGSDVLFHEEQRIERVWAWCLVMSPMLALPVVGIALVAGDELDGISLAWLVGIISAFGCIGGAIMLFFCRLITEVRSDGLFVKCIPLHRSFKRIPTAQVDSAEVVTYRPLLEYGGWGIRYGLKGKAYNASGNRGVRLLLKGGKRLLIGSQRPEELHHALAALIDECPREGAVPEIK